MQGQARLGGLEQICRHREQRDPDHYSVEARLPLLCAEIIVGSDAGETDPSEWVVRHGWEALSDLPPE
jgi:hypothetical protein